MMLGHSDMLSVQRTAESRRCQHCCCDLCLEVSVDVVACSALSVLNQL